MNPNCYTPMGNFLTTEETSELIQKLLNSKIVDFSDELSGGEMNSIVKKGTFEPVGYISADNQIELINITDLNNMSFHNYLKNLYFETIQKSS